MKTLEEQEPSSKLDIVGAASDSFWRPLVQQLEASNAELRSEFDNIKIKYQKDTLKLQDQVEKLLKHCEACDERVKQSEAERDSYKT